MDYSILMICFFASITTTALSQEHESVQQIDSLPITSVDWGYKPVSVVFADSAYALPDTLLVRGTIEGITSVPAGCGVFCWWGTAMIHLAEKPVQNVQDTVYIAVLCLYGQDSAFVGQPIKARVTKLFRRDIGNTCAPVFNRFDSNGQPFYKLIEPKDLQRR
jgi:hypothetical protein